MRIPLILFVESFILPVSKGVKRDEKKPVRKSSEERDFIKWNSKKLGFELYRVSCTSEKENDRKP